MLETEQDDHAEEAGLQELIEQFEAFLERREYSFFDDDGKTLWYYENRFDEGHMEAVVRPGYRLKSIQVIFWRARLNCCLTGKIIRAKPGTAG